MAVMLKNLVSAMVVVRACNKKRTEKASMTVEANGALNRKTSYMHVGCVSDKRGAQEHGVRLSWSTIVQECKGWPAIHTTDFCFPSSVKASMFYQTTLSTYYY